MNFFQHQRHAKRRTGLLIVLMTLAVICLIAITSVAVTLVWAEFQGFRKGWMTPDWKTVAIASAIVVSVVLAGSLAKMYELRHGGKVIAKRLGGRLLNIVQQSPEEHRLLNIVEEMALASGTPVPWVYVLPDTGINAFAAGLTPQDAVIGVTQGAIQLLSRDEMQGVIAHEFSHIYNGDMRINTRLVALVHGILILGLVGRMLLRGQGRSNSSSNTSSSNNSQNGALGAVGLVLCVAGFIGTLFGGLIKAAVSRQREYLADASAVQFTRNPDSIAGALKKIGGYEQGSRLTAEHAAEFSHLYFGPGLAAGLSGWNATHPSLRKRILRVDPHWDGTFSSIAALPSEENISVPPLEWNATFNLLPSEATAVILDMEAIEQSIARIGDPQPAHLAEAQHVLARLPRELKDAAHRCKGAQALVYSLWFARAGTVNMDDYFRFHEKIGVEMVNAMQGQGVALAALDPGLRLPLIDLAIPALKRLDKKQFKRFRDNLESFIQMDQNVELLEWTLLRIIDRNVMGAAPVTFKFNLGECANEIATLLGVLATVGQQRPDLARKTLAHAWVLFTFSAPENISLDLNTLDTALQCLRQLKPEEKPLLLRAMARCIEHDGKVSAAEAELMRAVADLLDCPMPPLLGTPFNSAQQQAVA